MDDRDAVYEVLVRYASAVDRRDWDAVGQCFAADARATYAGNLVGPGRAAIVDFVRGATDSIASTHLVGGVTIEVEGDRASTDQTALACHHLPGGKVRFRGLRYIDRLARRDGAWQIVERVHQPAWTAEADAGG